MSSEPSSTPRVIRRAWAWGVCAFFGFWVFQFFGNATRGYINTPSLFYWWGYQWFDPAADTQHGPLILLVSLWLAVRNLRRIPPGPDSASWLGAGAMLAGLALHVVGYAMQQTRVSILALLVFGWGLLVFAKGRRAGSAVLFPFAFLLLATPVNFLSELAFYLQLGVSGVAQKIAWAVGIDVIRNGTQLFSPDRRYQYEVSAACSGVRSMVALLGLALLVGYLYFRPWWARAVLVVLMVPFAFLGNVVRLTTIIIAGHGWGQAAGQWVHDGSGPLVFIVVLVLLLASAAAIKKACPGAAVAVAEPSVMTREPLPASRVRSTTGLTAAIIALAAAVAIGAIKKLDALPTRSETGVRLAADATNPAELPIFIGTKWAAQKAEVTAIERRVLPPDTGFSRANYLSTRNPRDQVFVSIVLSGRDRTSIHRPELCLVGQGWTITSKFGYRFDERGSSDGLPATILRIEQDFANSQGQRITVPSLFAYWFVSSENTVADHRAMLWHDTVQRLLHGRADRWAYVVVQTPAFDNEQAALARLQEVIAGVWPAVRAEGHSSLSKEAALEFAGGSGGSR